MCAPLGGADAGRRARPDLRTRARMPDKTSPRGRDGRSCGSTTTTSSPAPASRRSTGSPRRSRPQPHGGWPPAGRSSPASSAETARSWTGAEPDASSPLPNGSRWSNATAAAPCAGPRPVIRRSTTSDGGHGMPDPPIWPTATSSANPVTTASTTTGGTSASKAPDAREGLVHPPAPRRPRPHPQTRRPRPLRLRRLTRRGLPWVGGPGHDDYPTPSLAARPRQHLVPLRRGDHRNRAGAHLRRQAVLGAVRVDGDHARSRATECS